MNLSDIKKAFHKNKQPLLIWLILITASFLITVFQNKKPADTAQKYPLNIDTYIPPGFVLLPVDLNNGPALDGLLSAKGVVDLYTGQPEEGAAKIAAEAVKIIRSPQNPSHFAVLVPENQAGFLIKGSPSFYAVVQNPQKNGTKIKPLRKIKKSSIIIEP